MTELYKLKPKIIDCLNKAIEASLALMDDNPNLKDPEPCDKTLIVYADGGCDQTRGPAGGGVHALWFDRYSSETIVRSGNDYTKIGYLPKNDAMQLDRTLGSALDPHLALLLSLDPGDKTAIKEYRKVLKKHVLPKKEREAFSKQPHIVGYADLSLPVPAPGSNNIAELVGLIGSLQLILGTYKQNAFKQCFLYLDSMYALGVYRNIFKYAQKNWIGSNGEELKNKDLLKRIYQLSKELKDTGIYDEVITLWVKGHSGNNGNDRADAAASRAKSLSWNGRYDPVIEISKLEGKEKSSFKDFSRIYWGVDNDYSRFLCLTDWYMQANLELPTDDDGRTMVLMATGKNNNDGQEGKTDSMVRNAIYYTRELDPVLKKVHDHQQHVHGDLCQDIYKIRLNRLLTPQIYNDINLRGLDYVHRKDSSFSLVHWTTTPVTKQLRPARIAYKEIDRLNTLAHQTLKFHDLRKGVCVDKTFAVRNISEHFWDAKDESKKKRKCLLGNNDRILEIPLPLVDQKDYTMRLLVDMDIPPRNLMSNIADKDPELWVLTAIDGITAVGNDTVVNFSYWFFLGTEAMEGELLAWSAPNRNRHQYIIKGKKK